MNYSTAVIQLPLVKEPVSKTRIKASRDAADFCQDMQNLAQEAFHILLLNSKNAVINRVLISLGTGDSAYVVPRDIFRPAIEQGAISLICLHNHPSGDPTPSREDSAITRQIHEAGKLVGIRMLDHVIIGRQTDEHAGYYSFADQGEI